jgi:hypothetical protein
MATIEQNVYRSNLHKVEEMMENIHTAVFSLSQKDFKCMNINFLQRCQKSTEKNGHHFQHPV